MKSTYAPINENKVQNGLFQVLHNLKRSGGRGMKFYNIAPNIKFFSERWESDLLVQDFKAMLYEFEIKTSKSDFKNDFKKSKHIRIKKREGRLPNFFYYVLPEEFANDVKVPDYAGIYAYKHYQCSERGEVIDFYFVKAAAKIHDTPVTLKEENKILQTVLYKFWRGRTGKTTRFY